MPTKVVSPLCNFCKQENETIIHLFYECKLVETFWSTFIESWGQYFHINTMMTAEQILLGDVLYPNLFNFLILAAKRFIYTSRCQERIPTFVGFKNFVNGIQKVELFIANRADKLGKHIKKWGEFLQVLESEA